MKQRYPAPVLLDLLSRTADAMYEVESDDGAVRLALESVVKAVMGASDLSIAERDYFETFFAFLTARGRAGRISLTTALRQPRPQRRRYV